MPMTKPVNHAIDMLFRDYEKVFGAKPKIVDKEELASIVVHYTEDDENLVIAPESFQISVSETNESGSYKMYIKGKR